MVCRGCAGCGGMCRLRVSGAQELAYWGLCWLLRGSVDCFCCPHTSVLRPSTSCLAAFHVPPPPPAAPVRLPRPLRSLQNCPHTNPSFALETCPCARVCDVSGPVFWGRAPSAPFPSIVTSRLHNAAAVSAIGRPRPPGADSVYRGQTAMPVCGARLAAATLPPPPPP